MIFLNIEEVIDYHTEIINEFGGSHGIRDLGLLISAIEMPKATMFGEDLHPTIFDKAAAYLFHVVCNHAFIDGNKRSGLVVALTFLDVNGINIKYDADELEELVVRVAEGKASKKEISLFFQNAYEIQIK